MDADRALLRGGSRADAAAGRVHVPRLRGHPAAAAVRAGPRRAARLPALRRRPAREQTWPAYAFALLAFSLFGLLGTYAIERLQHVLPLNPQHLGPVEPALAFNTAASFTTNTNWQSYTPESTMGYLTQMAGLAWHNF